MHTYQSRACRTCSNILLTSDMIEELKSVLVPDEEIVRIREYSERMRTTAAARASEQSELRNVVSELESAVNTLRESTTRSAADWRSLSEHAAAMQAMENDKFDLAKQINEQESALSALEAEIEQLRRESDMIDDWSVDRDIDMDKDAYVAAHQTCVTALSRSRLCTLRKRTRQTDTVTDCAFCTTHSRIFLRY